MKSLKIAIIALVTVSALASCESADIRPSTEESHVNFMENTDFEIKEINKERSLEQGVNGEIKQTNHVAAPALPELSESAGVVNELLAEVE